MLWEQAAGCPSWRADILLSSLERKSLLTLEGQSPRQRVSLHDLHHDYVRYTHTNLAHLHRDVLEAYRHRCLRGWASGPDDGYFFQHLVYHFNGANRQDELHDLLLDIDWLEAQLRATDVIQLLADYDLALGNKTIALVRDALRLSAHHLARDPALLKSQLQGRLLAIEENEDIYDKNSSKSNSEWLRCLIPSLTPPGDGLLRTIAVHAEVYNVAVTADGRRAVSASRDATLRVWDLGSGKLLRTLAGHHAGNRGVVVTADGRRAVSASYDRTLKVWDLGSGKLLRTLTGHVNAVQGVAVTADSRRAISASRDERSGSGTSTQGNWSAPSRGMLAGSTPWR